MKKILLAAALACAASFGAQAQTTDQTPPPQSPSATPKRGDFRGPRRSPEDRAKMYTDQMKSQLNLTDEQYPKVLAVNTECIKRKDALRASGAADMRGGQRDIAQYRRQQFATILTPAQMDQLKAMNQQMHEQRRERMGNGNAGGGDDMTPQ